MVNAAAVVSTYTIAGVTFRASARTAAHIQHTIDRLAVTHPAAKLVILQPCYNTGVTASAGTHDKDAVLDFQIDGLDWWAAQRFLRSLGWACWFRHQGTWAARADWHIHAISLGYPGEVGYYVDGGVSLFGEKRYTSQVDDYYNHAYGLKDLHRAGSDTSWFPPDISATVFSYANYLTARPIAPQGDPVLTKARAIVLRIKNSLNDPKRHLVDLDDLHALRILGHQPEALAAEDFLNAIQAGAKAFGEEVKW